MLAFIHGIGLQEILIVLGLGLVLFGAKRLPGLGRGIGQGLLEFKRGLSGAGTQDPPATGPRALPPPSSTLVDDKRWA